MVLPPGYEPVHQREEARIVRWLQQVSQFMHHDVFEALRGFFASSVLRRIVRALWLQLPHFVFMR